MDVADCFTAATADINHLVSGNIDECMLFRQLTLRSSAPIMMLAMVRFMLIVTSAYGIWTTWA